MLLPEFLGGFEDDEEEVSPAKKAKKSKKNKKGEGIPSEDTSSGETHLGAIASGADHVVEDDLDHHSPNANPVVSVDDSHFQDWHVSAEFVREEKIRKENIINKNTQAKVVIKLKDNHNKFTAQQLQKFLNVAQCEIIVNNNLENIQVECSNANLVRCERC